MLTTVIASQRVRAFGDVAEGVVEDDEVEVEDEEVEAYR